MTFHHFVLNLYLVIAAMVVVQVLSLHFSKKMKQNLTVKI